MSKYPFKPIKQIPKKYIFTCVFGGPITFIIIIIIYFHFTQYKIVPDHKDYLRITWALSFYSLFFLFRYSFLVFHLFFLRIFFLFSYLLLIILATVIFVFSSVLNKSLYFMVFVTTSPCSCRVGHSSRCCWVSSLSLQRWHLRSLKLPL